MEEKLTNLFSKALPTIIEYGTKILIAVAVLYVGLWLIKRLTKGIRVLMEKRNVDSTLIPFVSSVVNIALKVLLAISVISYLGIPMTSFVAVLGAAGLAVGMALQGTLQNFAGGVMLLLFRPFKVGDFVEVKGYSGVVKEIQVFNTIITTTDNKVVIIPNGGISTDSMVNYSTMETRRVDLKFGIGYSDDIDKAYAAVRAVGDANDKILKDPALFVAVNELGDSSVNMVVRVWVKSEDYWPVYFYMVENVKKEFDRQGISIPFPQRDVHIVSQQQSEK